MTSPARIVGLLLLIALLGWTGWEARWTPQPAPPPDIVAEATPAQTTPPQQFAPISDYRVTLERPLFFPTRRLPSETSAATEGMPGAPQPIIPSTAPRLTLSAVIEENGKRSALLSAPGQAESTRLQEGERIGDWLLVDIAEDSVTLEANGKREQLLLRSFDAVPHAGPMNSPVPPRPLRLRRSAGGTSSIRQPE